MRHLFLAIALFAAVPASADETDQALGFRIWLNNYRNAAETRGIKREWLDAALTNVTYLPRVVVLDRAQPDDSGKKNVFAAYLTRQLTQSRIDDGLVRAADNRTILKAVTTKSGVPGEIVVAIWGMETSYGRVTGNFDLPSALATLAYDGRRATLFTRELDAAVQMVGQGKTAREQMRGSWAGAFGQSQFLPSSYLAHGVDGDGDGRSDLWNSVPDALASIGRYLADASWQPDYGWGFRTGVPANFDRASVVNPVKRTQCTRPLERHSVALPAKDWKAKGFVPLNAVWPADNVVMALVEPDGPGEGAFLTTSNYRAIMEYNCSNFYALSVALLGDAIKPATR